MLRFPRALPLVVAALAVLACEKKKPEGAAAPAPGGAGAVATGDRILLGHVGSLTGSEATFGDSTDKGIQLAIEEVNAKGGVKGKPLALKTYDNQGKPEESAIAATRLVLQDRVAVLLGEVASTRSLAMAPIADANHVPMITPSSTNPRVTKENGKVRPYVFRVCFIDPFQGTVMAKFAREHLKISRVAVLRDVGNDYSMGLADFFLAKFKELGGTIVDDQSYKAGDQDFKAQLTNIKGKNPEAIYVPGYYTDVALIARQSRELGMKQPLMGGDGWDSARLYEIGGKALEGSYFSNHYSPEDPAPRIQDFVKRYRERFGAVPDSLAAQGYDAARIAADAMGRAKDLSGEAIRDALAATRDYPGVTGVISIDADHDAVKPAVVLEIKGSAGHYVATVQPDQPQAAK
ncbi:ABC transporter substrate-binding protein [Anaeromyxobacter dehalogenans]|uniref:Amino acid/amide ABC transporter substrate-binding protein, HAAT family n=1 Tax=Anaeromyxobacter dehalogenans (strain 2CP-C) TaxID=290397 RepID=Q2IHG5_ANADE|nr:ABC transporter substrate-binding protein [Anaeromyxobacter dehalogenans]ABC84025.1 amino acid/amide ABC transporter substrate-binding protein, HAAT family [Anaeromyxobacter dehalogenans 2CP-C]